MKGEFHPVDDLLRKAAGDPTPSPDDVITGRRMLMAAMRAEAERDVSPARPGLFTRATALAAGALVLVLAVAVGATVVTSRPVTAQGDLAVLAERTPDLAVSPEDYVYTKVVHSDNHYVTGAEIGLPTTGTVAYHLPIVRERWVGSDGSREIIRVGEPTFSNAEHRQAYNRSTQRKSDRVGEVVSDSFDTYTSRLDERNWSTDPGELLGQLRAAASSHAPEHVAVVDVALALLAEPLVTPEIRTATILALDELNPGEVIRSVDGTTTLSVEYDIEGVAYRLDAVFGADGDLLNRATILVEGYPDAGLLPGSVDSKTQFLQRSRVRGIDD